MEPGHSNTGTWTINPHAGAVSEDQEGSARSPCGCGSALFVFLCLELGQCQPSARSFVNDLPFSGVPSYQFQLLATSAAAQMCPEDQDLFAWFRLPIGAEDDFGNRQGIRQGLNLHYRTRVHP